MRLDGLQPIPGTTSRIDLASAEVAALPSTRATPITESRQQLGESPLWFADESALRWVDIQGGQVLSLVDHARGISEERGEMRGEMRVDAAGLSNVSLLRRTSSDNLLVASDAGVHVVTPGFALVDDLGTVPDLALGLRFNDGACDPQGRLWIGTTDQAESATGSVYRLERGAAPVSMIEGVDCPNGLAWSADGAHLYFVETVLRRIYRFEWSGATGTLGEPVILVQFEESGPLPDGMALDTDGRLWVAFWGGGMVLRISAAGEPEFRVDVDCAHPTSVAFGDAGTGDLYITSALRPRESGDAGGRLYRATVPADGAPVHRFA